MPPNINFNTKHLSKGDTEPPFSKLRLFNMRYCPYAHRTVLALIAKEVDYELVNIDLIDKPEWFIAKTVFGKVPALELEEGLCISESLITVEYLDDVYPKRPLLPKDPVKKALDKLLVEACAPVFSLYYKLLKLPDSVDEATVKSYQNALDLIEEQLRSRASKFLDGELPGFADYMIWPWFERLMTMDYEEKVTIDGQRFKLLVEWIGNMYKDPVVMQYAVSKEILVEFQKEYSKFQPGTGAKLNYERLQNK